METWTTDYLAGWKHEIDGDGVCANLEYLLQLHPDWCAIFIDDDGMVILRTIERA